MLSVAGVPLIHHTVDAAINAGATRIVLVVEYEVCVIKDYVDTVAFDVPVTLVEQVEKRGTADAVRCVAAELSSDPFAVLNGDVSHGQASLETLYAATPAVGFYRVSNPEAYGVLRTDGDSVLGESVNFERARPLRTSDTTR